MRWLQFSWATFFFLPQLQSTNMNICWFQFSSVQNIIFRIKSIIELYNFPKTAVSYRIFSLKLLGGKMRCYWKEVEKWPWSNNLFPHIFYLITQKQVQQTSITKQSSSHFFSSLFINSTDNRASALFSFSLISLLVFFFFNVQLCEGDLSAPLDLFLCTNVIVDLFTLCLHSAKSFQDNKSVCGHMTLASS